MEETVKEDGLVRDDSRVACYKQKMRGWRKRSERRGYFQKKGSERKRCIWAISLALLAQQRKRETKKEIGVNEVSVIDSRSERMIFSP